MTKTQPFQKTLKIKGIIEDFNKTKTMDYFGNDAPRFGRAAEFEHELQDVSS